MLDIKKIIENKQIYIEGLSNRGYDVTNLDIVISLNENRGKLITDGDVSGALLVTNENYEPIFVIEFDGLQHNEEKQKNSNKMLF